MKKLVVVALQQTFLQMVQDQLKGLMGDALDIRTVSLNDLDENPLLPDETILYFAKGVRSIVESMFPVCRKYIHARRENLICNMRDLFALSPGQRILVVNDVRLNTDDMTSDLKALNLGHTFLPYYPEESLPENIYRVVTAGERMLVPANLKDVPVIDIGLRFISLKTFFLIHDHFQIAFDHAVLARRYMMTMLILSEKWPVLGENRYRKPLWLGIRHDLSAPFTFSHIIKKSVAMHTLCTEAEKMAATDQPVHIYGMTGTGKTGISQAIHNASRFSSGPFVSINCAARTPEALALELFGWEDGSMVHRSLFESAENGTLCIEEVGRLSEKLQAGLLQAVTEKRIVRSNGKSVVDINVRLITTSSQPLERASKGGFNHELLLMITRYSCRVPTLIERMDDFEELVEDYLVNHLRKPYISVPEDTMALLKDHTWEGNVQELYNVLQHMICMSDGRLVKENMPYYISKNISFGAQKEDALRKNGSSQSRSEFSTITDDLTSHGFLEESRQILLIYRKGKESSTAYGRGAVLEMLSKKGFSLSTQQLRLKLERMDKLGLLTVLPGRGGTTISEKGEEYLKKLPGSTDH